MGEQSRKFVFIGILWCRVTNGGLNRLYFDLFYIGRHIQNKIFIKIWFQNFFNVSFFEILKNAPTVGHSRWSITVVRYYFFQNLKKIKSNVHI